MEETRQKKKRTLALFKKAGFPLAQYIKAAVALKPAKASALLL
jgi:hypothetical protein